MTAQGTTGSVDYAKKEHIGRSTPDGSGKKMPSKTTIQIEASWTVQQNIKARKGEETLPEKLKFTSKAIKRSLKMTGKAKGFTNYGPLKQLGKDYYHCHINSGKPTYVMIWKVDKLNKSITISYIGTHGDAPY